MYWFMVILTAIIGLTVTSLNARRVYAKPRSDEDDVKGALLVGTVVTIFGSLAWFIAWPIAIVAGIGYFAYTKVWAWIQRTAK